MTSAHPKISILIVARNEEKILANCLSHTTWADEVVVLLDRTTDCSPQIARKSGARVVEGAWELEGERRNAGVEACQGSWILEVDADEEISEDLKIEIQDLIATTPHDWFEVTVDNYVGDRLVKFGWGGSFGTTAAPRLFRKGVKVCGKERIHPSVKFQGSKGPRTQAVLKHRVDEDLSDMLKRFDRYTLARAQDLFERKTPETTRQNIRRFFSRFYKCFIRRKGYREGALGFMIAILTGLYPLVSFLKYRELQQKESNACAFSKQ
jgi:glycosyltransferase involved in cell wall biosynthesis